MEDFISVKDAAKRMNISRQAVSRMLRLGQLPGIQIGRAWMVAWKVLVKISVHNLSHKEIKVAIPRRYTGSLDPSLNEVTPPDCWSNEEVRRALARVDWERAARELRQAMRQYGEDKVTES